MSKKDLSERDICTKFITPALQTAGWDLLTQIREEVTLTPGRIIVRGKMVTRGKTKRADYLLYHKPNIPIGVIEAKDNHHGIGAGMQQALEYADLLDVPFVFSTNGDGFLFHDRTQINDALETELALDEFPAPAALWLKYRAWKGFKPEEEKIILQDYFDDGSGKALPLVCNKDLFIVITGAGVTNPAILEEDIGEAYVSQHVALISPIDKSLSRWLLICLMARAACRGQLLKQAYGAGKPGLNLNGIRMLKAPIPSLVEQHQILAKVNQLLSLCDALDTVIQTQQQTTSRLLDALIAEALSHSPDPETVETETQLALSD